MAKFINYLVILLLATVGRCNSVEKKERRLILQGQISVEGNEPFTRMVFTTKKGRFLISRKDQEKFRNMQNKRIKIHALLIKRGPGEEFLNVKGEIKILDIETLQ